MIYIYTEDSTSGYDFIKNIIERVIKPVVPWRIESLGGCGTCMRFLRGLTTDMYNSGDILVLYFDAGTLAINDLLAAAMRLRSRGVRIYLQNFYCFESAFFTYSAFLKHEICFGKYQQMYEDFRCCLLKGSNFELFKKKYAQFNFDKLTLEKCANAVFSICSNACKCVHVSKSDSYDTKTLRNCLDAESFDKFYYNNGCSKQCAYDKRLLRMTKDKSKIKTRCKLAKNYGFCHIDSVHKGTTANLRRFYYESALSTKFLEVDVTLQISTENLDTLLK
jgi:hypothetical protein